MAKTSNMYYQGKTNNLHHTLLLLLYCLLRAATATAAVARATCDPPSRGSKLAPPGAAITQSVIGRWADDGTSSLREHHHARTGQLFTSRYKKEVHTMFQTYNTTSGD